VVEKQKFCRFFLLYVKEIINFAPELLTTGKNNFIYIINYKII